jgi:hypothetical protein
MPYKKNIARIHEKNDVYENRQKREQQKDILSRSKIPINNNSQK